MTRVRTLPKPEGAHVYYFGILHVIVQGKPVPVERVA